MNSISFRRAVAAATGRRFKSHHPDIEPSFVDSCFTSMFYGARKGVAVTSALVKISMIVFDVIILASPKRRSMGRRGFWFTAKTLLRGLRHHNASNITKRVEVLMNSITSIERSPRRQAGGSNPVTPIERPFVAHMFHVYVLRSQKTGRRYVGSCEDLRIVFAVIIPGNPKRRKHGAPRVLVHGEG